ncbi:MAG: F0F1 ATP synthase subunit gamma [Anaerolineae bacterium]|jgi:F-type H+-transporting ATPase subunit gamma|nr:F0F1 ATP synthase subunit gamma [Chloroflexota bacterium]
MEDIEQIRERRDNIEAISPIVTSMRTISAGSWRQALQRREASTRFSDYMQWALAGAMGRLSADQLKKLGIPDRPVPPRRPLLLVVSSQRGLCGAYNDLVVRGADELITGHLVQSEDVLVASLGSRGTSLLRQLGRRVDIDWPLPASRVASMELVAAIARELYDVLEDGTADAVYVLYSPYRAGALAPVISERWLPIDTSLLPPASQDPSAVIIEGDAVSLVRQALHEWATARLYRMIIDAAASEQAARYRAMDTASGNLARLIEELTLQYHSARQHAITMEMLDLAAGAEGSRSGVERSEL